MGCVKGKGYAAPPRWVNRCVDDPREFPSRSFRKVSNSALPNAGWHLTSFESPEGIARKLKHAGTRARLCVRELLTVSRCSHH